MNYELAKELEDAGYPQYSSFLADYVFEGESIGSKRAYAPTLSELIEATPNMYELKKTAPERGSLKSRWIANGWDYLMDNNSVPKQGFADTPEEAVARLWLSINKK